MATIPSSQKFHTVKSTVDTENRGSKSLNANRTIFTMQDIQDTVTAGGGVDGSGTAGKISKWLDANTVTDSIMAEAGALINLTGGLTASGNLIAVDCALSGALTAVGGTFSANVAAVDIAASGNVTAVNVTGTGNIGGVAGVFSGNVTGVNVTGSGIVSGASLVSAGAITAAGAITGVTNLTMNGVLSTATAISSESFAVAAVQNAPAAVGSAGTAGTIVFAADGVYFCIAPNTWRKATLAAF